MTRDLILNILGISLFQLNQNIIMSHENDAFRTTKRREGHIKMVWKFAWYGVVRFRNYGAISLVRGL